jgi:hypothetical protein
MASSDTRSGFRLPWSSDRSHDESAPEGAEPSPEAVDEPVSDDIAWPEDPNIHARLGIPTHGQRPPDESPPDAAATDAAATETEAQESQRMVEIDVPTAPAAAPRKPSKLMADLSAAILATAASARDQALLQLDADARQITEAIRESATEGGTTLRKRSDDDVAGIRDWSKAEIARIREETDGRISTRKAQLENELAAHASSVNNRVEEVQFEVDRFRSDMDAYFERLASEDDPSTLATMVEAMPDLPSFDAWNDIDPLADLPAPEAAAEVDEAPVSEAVVADEPAQVVEAEAPADVAGEVEPEAVAAEGEPVADEAAAELIDDGSINVDEAEAADETVGTLDPEAEELAPSAGVGKGWGEDEGEWAVRPEGDDVPRWDGDAPDGFPSGSEGGDPVDRGAIMAALEAAAEAVVAAEAAAESADQAEAAADVAETAAELVVGRNGTEDGTLDPEAQAALDARVGAGGFEESYADRLASLLPPADADGEPKTTQVVVSGLVSVASIASFKRHLGRLSGVQSVAVASGPEGEFVFNVTHRPDVSFRDAIPSMQGFAARVTGTGDGMIAVTARDPESES